MASGQDGQFLKLNHDGKVAGRGRQWHGHRQPASSPKPAIWVFDPHDNLIAGDTSVGRVTVMSK